MGLIYRIKKGSALSYSEMDANLSTLSDATGSSVTGSFISGVTQTFQLGNGTSFTTTIASASYAVSASHVEFADDAANATSASYSISSSHSEFTDLAGSATNALAVSGSVQAVTFDSSGSFSISGSNVTFSGLSTTEPTTTGSLWLSGSGAGASSGSKYLMVFAG